MNIEDVNKIFKTKYPEGEVFQRGEFNHNFRVSLKFNKTSKVYSYNCCNYADLLLKLGFNVIYQKTVKLYNELITEYKKDLNNGFIEDEFFGNVDLTESEKQKRIDYITEHENILKKAIIVD